MPGTTSKGMFAAASSSASSPPRPKMYGSPPLRRTTVLPLLALATSNWFSSSCGPGSETQQVRVHQRVIDHHVGATEQLRSAQREQADVAGPGAHQIDHAFCSLHSLPVYALATIPATTQNETG